MCCVTARQAEACRMRGGYASRHEARRSGQGAQKEPHRRACNLTNAHLVMAR